MSASSRAVHFAMIRRSRALVLIAGLLLGCGTEPSGLTETPLAPPPAPPPPPPLPSSKPTLSIVTVDPGDGATIPGKASVRAHLRYRLPTSERGSIGVVILCVKDGQLVCVDAGTLKSVSGREGEVDVSFSVPGPAGATITVQLRLGEEGTDGAASVGISYRAAP